MMSHAEGLPIGAGDGDSTDLNTPTEQDRIRNELAQAEAAAAAEREVLTRKFEEVMAKEAQDKIAKERCENEEKSSASGINQPFLQQPVNPEEFQEMKSQMTDLTSAMQKLMHELPAMMAQGKGNYA